MEDPEEWQRTLRDQLNIATRAQALEQGLTDHVISANIAAHRWLPLFRGVFAVVTGEPTAAMWRMAALLFVRGEAVLSHASAAAVHGLPGGREEGPVHLTVPYRSSARGCTGIVVHRSRAFAHIRDRNVLPPVTTKVATLIDLAVDADGPREAMQVLTAGATRARLGGWTIVEALENRPPRRYEKALMAAARRLAEGVESPLEADFATDVLEPHGFPSGTRQVARVVEGRRRIEDHEWELPLGVLTVRLDGWRYHANRRTAHADRQRDNAAELEGRARLTFGSEEVRDPCRTAAMLARRMTQLGWTGEMRRCPRCP
ncbi:hypothetical protein [Actinomycetospora soli]|uniref:hypothetical protein n=1 Tax=Actinomycetospora soli TaxID=2893887 RepID=UPI001E60DA20|nr:hypothetical protein [Actinomycetospora soli]MCD2188420.1 hypothetical protein [Actinomycetospora soli]